LQMHSKHCGVRNLFVDFLSSFQRPDDTANFGRPTTSPALTGARFLPLLRLRVKGLLSALFTAPSTARGGSCSTEPRTCQAPVPSKAEPTDAAGNFSVPRGSW